MYTKKRSLCYFALLQREGNCMSNSTRIRENESLESALRRFRRDVSKSGRLSEYRKREYYESPSVRRKKKSEAARARARRRRRR